MTSPLEKLGSALCPWLDAPYQRFEVAHRSGHLGHAWLISGPVGCGKINLALVMANRLLGGPAATAVLEPEEALEGLAHRHVPTGRHPDLHWVYPEEEKATISVEQVRGIGDALALTAHGGGAKVVILEPAEAMTIAAANALLKTLEEPTAATYLLLVSHSPARLPATVRSRCQRLAVAAPARMDVARWLKVTVGEIETVARVVGESPLVMAAYRNNKTIDINAIEANFVDLCEDKLSCQTVAERWASEDASVLLAWLMRSLHEEIRRRAAASGPTEVTVPGVPTLHNVCRGLPARTLFEQYDRAEKLSNQLGSGVNVELALQALLGGFQVNRGNS